MYKTFTLRLQDLNDNSPVFTRSTYSFIIREDIAVGSTVGRYSSLASLSLARYVCFAVGAQPFLLTNVYHYIVGSGGRAVERRTVNRGDGGSIPPTAISKLRQFRSPHICLYLSEETLKAGGPFNLLSMPGEVKDPTQGVNV